MVWVGFGLGPLGILSPAEKGFAVADVPAGQGFDDVEDPALVLGVGRVPHAGDEEVGVTFAGGFDAEVRHEHIDVPVGIEVLAVETGEGSCDGVDQFDGFLVVIAG